MGINVLSLFDGMSCGQIALNRAGFKVSKYYASEIDKYAIAVTQANYPDTIQLGSVVDIDCSKLEHIDLLAGGSPCQSFSFAGKRKGMSTKCETEILTLEHYLELKHEGYEFEGQSYLFWEYMRVLKEVKPKYFLLENVMMGEKWERVLSKAIGVNPIEINSALVSAQSRKRLYWTNIGMEPRGLFGDLESVIKQPKDRGILLRDVLETEVEEKYYLSGKLVNTLFNTRSGSEQQFKEAQPANVDGKGVSLTARYYKMGRQDNYIVASRGRNPENPSDRTTGASLEQRLEPRTDGKTNTLTSVQKDNMVMQLNPSKESGGQPYQQNRVYSPDSISPALSAQLSSGSHLIALNERQQKNYKDGDEKANTLLSTSWKGSQANGMTLASTEHRIRRLTPVECEKLQTCPVGYTSMVSDTQRYRMLGNGWTVDVVAYIFSYITSPSTPSTTPT